VLARVIAGQSHGVVGAMQRETTAPLFLDVHLPAGRRFEQALAADLNAFVYVYRGEVSIEGTAVPETRMAILAAGGDTNGVVIEAAAAPARVLLIAGRPLNEPIAQYGPFVMNTQEEIYTAVNDFREGRLGSAA
jgi:quercetin 2,3-dioxygenase